MAKKNWQILEDYDGRMLPGREPHEPAPEVGEELELELTKEQETALVAAGWIGEPAKGKKKED